MLKEREKGEGERGERSSVANGMAQLPQSSASLKHLPVWLAPEGLSYFGDPLARLGGGTYGLSLIHI